MMAHPKGDWWKCPQCRQDTLLPRLPAGIVLVIVAVAAAASALFR